MSPRRWAPALASLCAACTTPAEDYSTVLADWYRSTSPAARVDLLVELRRATARRPSTPGLRLALAYHAAGLGYVEEAERALAEEAEDHPEATSLAAALALAWGLR